MSVALQQWAAVGGLEPVLQVPPSSPCSARLRIRARVTSLTQQSALSQSHSLNPDDYIIGSYIKPVTVEQIAALTLIFVFERIFSLSPHAALPKRRLGAAVSRNIKLMCLMCT